jgi:hypothetical protein
MRLSFIDSDLLHKNAALYEHLSFTYRLKLNALFIDGENEAVLYSQSLVM